MYLDRRMQNDPLMPLIGDIERKVVEAIEEHPRQPVTASSLEMSKAALISCIRKLRRKGFNIDVEYRHGGYFWDGTSK